MYLKVLVPLFADIHSGCGNRIL